MELLEGIQTRRSIRAFKSTPIPEETIRKILQAAGRSPSHTNTQPWEVAVVCGKKKEALSKILYDMAKAEVKPNPDVPSQQKWPEELEKRHGEHGARRLQAIGIERGDQEGRKALQLTNFKFFGAPCALFLFMDSTLSPWSSFDMGLFAQTLILSAHSFGLGSCLQAALTRYPDAVRDFLCIPKTKRLMMGISLGYPDPEARINTYHATRVGLDDFVRWYV